MEKYGVKKLRKFRETGEFHEKLDRGASPLAARDLHHAADASGV
jgi:hypothetical protein